MTLERRLASERATVLCGQDIAAALRPGDVLALHGDLGAGKSTLARAVIRALLADPELDVPSPTFTLVQTYEGRLAVRHFDLYRLSGPDELVELGFEDDLPGSVTLVEWPDRAADILPLDAIHVVLEDDGDGRRLRISGPADVLSRLERSFQARDFLDANGWQGADRAWFAGDASSRSYETVSLPGKETRLLMNSPRLVLGPPVKNGRAYAEIVHTAQTVTAFVAIDRAMRDRGLAVPEIHAEDLDRGFLLLEDLGHEPFLGADGAPIAERYEEAARLLAAIHRHPWPQRLEPRPGIVHEIPPFDNEAMLIEAQLLLDWYLPEMLNRSATQAERLAFEQIWNTLFTRLARAETSIVLRDYHSPNIIWRGDREGFDRLGLIDFQDAMIGPAAYDLASLALDARVTIPQDLERRTVEAYVSARTAAGSFDRAGFEEAYAIMAAQRNSKILGIFVRLHRRDGKPQYLRHLPRIRDYLRRSLAHPALKELRRFYEDGGLLEDIA